MTTITLTVPGCAPRESSLRRLALTAGIALVRWAHQRPPRAAQRAPLTQEQQALRVETERAIAQQALSHRYGITQ